MMQEFKTTRDIIYDKTNETSARADAVAEKAAADTAYLAMMLDIDINEGDDDDE